MKSKLLLLALISILLYACNNNTDYIINIEENEIDKNAEISQVQKLPDLWNPVFFDTDLNISVECFGTGPLKILARQTGNTCLYNAIKNAIMTHNPRL